MSNFENEYFTHLFPLVLSFELLCKLLRPETFSTHDSLENQELKNMKPFILSLVHGPDNHNGVITHLEPDILECEVKWALESISTNKASGGDEIPVELFQILNDDAVKVMHSICQQIWKTQQWPQDWKRSVFVPVPKKGNPKEFQTTAQFHSSHTLVK